MLRPLFTAAAVAALAACATGPARTGAAPTLAAVADPSMGLPSGGFTGYFRTAVLDAASILGPPPAPDSPQGLAERTVYEQTRSLAGSPRWTLAIQDNDLWGGGALKRFSCALGVSVDAKQTPAAWRILHKVELDVRTISGPAKTFYSRTRPAIGNDKPICVPREDWMRTNGSYPSGHAMTAWAWGLILAELAPAKADAALATGKESGDSRVICGVHYVSDVEAGRTLGSAMVARLHAEPAFEADMAEAKREMAAATAKPQGCG